MSIPRPDQAFRPESQASKAGFMASLIAGSGLALTVIYFGASKDPLQGIQGLETARINSSATTPQAKGHEKFSQNLPKGELPTYEILSIMNDMSLAPWRAQQRLAGNMEIFIVDHNYIRQIVPEVDPNNPEKNVPVDIHPTPDSDRTKVLSQLNPGVSIETRYSLEIRYPALPGVNESWHIIRYQDGTMGFMLEEFEGIIGRDTYTGETNIPKNKPDPIKFIWS